MVEDHWSPGGRCWVESHTWILRFVGDLQSSGSGRRSDNFDSPLILWAITAIILCKRKPRVDHTQMVRILFFTSYI